MKDLATEAFFRALSWTAKPSAEPGDTSSASASRSGMLSNTDKSLPSQPTKLLGRIALFASVFAAGPGQVILGDPKRGIENASMSKARFVPLSLGY